MIEQLQYAQMPKPPARLINAATPQFEASKELGDWVRETFLEPIGPLYNADHEHLGSADILFVWSSKTFKHQQKEIVGTAQLGRPSGVKGGKELKEWQWRSWHPEGELPDFVITLCVPYFLDDTTPDQKCAVIEHELYHCAQEVGLDGSPRYDRWANPIWGMKGHDVEEFIGVVRRYGAHSSALQDLADTLQDMPSAPRSVVNAVCGCGAAL